MIVFYLGLTIPKKLLCVISNASLDIYCIVHDLSYTFVQCLKVCGKRYTRTDAPTIDRHDLTRNGEN